jgi:hypothetical protein
MATSTNFNEASVSQRAMTLGFGEQADQQGDFGERFPGDAHGMLT